MTAFNRTIVLLSFIGLAGWLGFLAKIGTLTAVDIATILAAVGTPIGLYVGLKGKNGDGEK